MVETFRLIVNALRPAFSREKTFFWFVLIALGFCMSSYSDRCGGVSRFVRLLGINPKHYTSMLHFFSSTAIDLTKLVKLWVGLFLNHSGLLSCFTYKRNGRSVLLVDVHISSREGHKMPGTKKLVQCSENNSKKAFVNGHAHQTVSLVCEAPGQSKQKKKSPQYVSVPLASGIHLGTKESRDDRATLFTKCADMITTLLPKHLAFYLIGDSYYSASSFVQNMLQKFPQSQVIMKVRSNAVGYEEPKPNPPGKRGRKRKYGTKIRLKDLFSDTSKFRKEAATIYNQKEEVLIREEVLFSRNLGRQTLFILVILPYGRKTIFSTLDLQARAVDIIELYSLRFKIEEGYKEGNQTLGSYLYRFWLKCLKPNPRGKTRYLDDMTAEDAEKYLHKSRCYEIYTQIAAIAQGILLILGLKHQTMINEMSAGRGFLSWNGIASSLWMRTVRMGHPPSERRVSMAFRFGVSEFLKIKGLDRNLKKFIKEKTCVERKKGNNAFILQKMVFP